MDTWKVCPQLITVNKEGTHYIGYINTSQGRQFKVQIELGPHGQLKGARVKCEWALQALLEGYGHVLQQRLNQASNLTSFLEEFRSFIERRVEETSNTVPSSSKLCGDLMQELEHLGWHRLVSVDPSFQKIQLKCEDARGRTHIIKLQLHAQHPEKPPSCQVDLPKLFDFQWSVQGGLSQLFEQFQQCLTSYQDFWDQVGEIDKQTWVLEPEKPTFSARHRRIVLSTSVSLQLSVEPDHPRQLPDCRFLGSEQAIQPHQDSFNRNLHLWDESVSLLANLQILLEQQFPSPTTSRKEDFSMECGICYAYRLGTDIPDKTCDDVRCGQPFHTTCLYEWLRGLPSSRQSFNTVFGECPYCSKPITVKMPTTVG
ncbi:E3 ubiquitin-protein ligase FANCL-like isoform X2 [Liolophura sinensis]